MTALKHGDLARLLAAWTPDIRLILLAGPDEGGARAAGAQVAAVLADPADPMSVTDLAADALKADPARLADEAAALSMFGSRRLVRVSGAGEAVGEAVGLLLDAPVAGNPVLMLAGDLAKTSALRKLAESSKAARLLLFYPLAGEEGLAFVRDRARTLGLRFEPGIAERLLAASGGDSGVLAAELDKFALFLDADPAHPRTLDRSHLAQLGADSADDDQSAFVTALVAGDARAAERQLRRLSDGSAIPVLRAVARRLMQLAEARATFDRGQPAAAAVKALRPPIFWREVGATAQALPNWPQPRIAAGLQAMLAGERAIKTANGPGEAAGWQALLSLLGERRLQN